MKKAIIFVGVSVAFILMSLSPAEPQGEIEPYMTVYHELPKQHEVNVTLWEPVTPTVNKEDKDSEFTEQEILLMERVTMSEASTEPFEGKVAVAKTILNRAKMYDMSIEQVVYEPYQYSVTDNGKPSEEVKRAVLEAINDTELPDNMIYFKQGEYHGFGVPYKQIGNHYFSLSERSVQ